eukprot:TRINITY_DN9422_c0_g2_i2.p1 TRINITY_DN9422_c0_g2~~TRINITY_DN9422_c0_g2_i2.p1  ORF type:complete len:4167 (+),score=1009.40 TRINITY_DN9422_c0_g2_i2:137-12637(+)
MPHGVWSQANHPTLPHIQQRPIWDAAEAFRTADAAGFGVDGVHMARSVVPRVASEAAARSMTEILDAMSSCCSSDDSSVELQEAAAAISAAEEAAGEPEESSAEAEKDENVGPQERFQGHIESASAKFQQALALVRRRNVDGAGKPQQAGHRQRKPGGRHIPAAADAALRHLGAMGGSSSSRQPKVKKRQRAATERAPLASMLGVSQADVSAGSRPPGLTEDSCDSSRARAVSGQKKQRGERPGLWKMLEDSVQPKAEDEQKASQIKRQRQLLKVAKRIMQNWNHMDDKEHQDKTGVMMYDVAMQKPDRGQDRDDDVVARVIESRRQSKEREDEITLYEAAEMMASTNVPVYLMTAVLERFARQAMEEGRTPTSQLTRTFFEHCSLYGDMVDRLASMMQKAKQFVGELAGGLVDDSLDFLGLDKQRSQLTAFFDSTRPEDTRLGISIQRIKQFIASLDWDSFQADFSKWTKAVSDNDVVLRDQLETLLGQADEVLGLLTQSKVVLDETFARRLVTTTKNLAGYFEKMKDLVEDGTLNLGAQSAMKAMKLRNQIQELQGECARQEKQVASASALNKRLEDSKQREQEMSTTAPRRRQKIQPKTKVISEEDSTKGRPERNSMEDIAHGDDDLQGGEAGTSSTSGAGGRLGAQRRAERWQHVEAALNRLLMRGKSHFEVIHLASQERQDMCDAMVADMRRQRRREDVAHLQHDWGDVSFASGVHWAVSRARQDCRREVQSIFEEGREDAEQIGKLWQRQGDLCDALNSMTCDINFVDILQPSQDEKPPREKGKARAARYATWSSQASSEALSSECSEGQEDGADILIRLLKEHSSEIAQKIQDRNDILASIDKIITRLTKKVNKKYGEGSWEVDAHRKDAGQGQVDAHRKDAGQGQAAFLLNPQQLVVEMMVKQVKQAHCLGVFELGRETERELSGMLNEVQSLSRAYTEERKARERTIGAGAPEKFNVVEWLEKTEQRLYKMIPVVGDMLGDVKARIERSKAQRENFFTSTVVGADAIASMGLNLSLGAAKGPNSVSDLAQVDGEVNPADGMMRQVTELKARRDQTMSQSKLVAIKVGRLNEQIRIHSTLFGKLEQLTESKKNIRELRGELREAKFHFDCAKKGISLPTSPSGHHEAGDGSEMHGGATSRGTRMGAGFLGTKQSLRPEVSFMRTAEALLRQLAQKPGMRHTKRHGDGYASQLGYATKPITQSQIKIELAKTTRRAEILAGKLAKKRVDIQSLIDEVHALAGGNCTNLLDSRQALFDKWSQEMKAWRAKIQVQGRMINFWHRRMEAWYSEVAMQYGDHVVTMLKDPNRPRTEVSIDRMRRRSNTAAMRSQQRASMGAFLLKEDRGADGHDIRDMFAVRQRRRGGMIGFDLLGLEVSGHRSMRAPGADAPASPHGVRDRRGKRHVVEEHADGIAQLVNQWQVAAQEHFRRKQEKLKAAERQASESPRSSEEEFKGSSPRNRQTSPQDDGLQVGPRAAFFKKTGRRGAVAATERQESQAQASALIRSRRQKYIRERQQAQNLLAHRGADRHVRGLMELFGADYVPMPLETQDDNAGSSDKDSQRSERQPPIAITLSRSTVRSSTSMTVQSRLKSKGMLSRQGTKSPPEDGKGAADASSKSSSEEDGSSSASFSSSESGLSSLAPSYAPDAASFITDSRRKSARSGRVPQGKVFMGSAVPLLVRKNSTIEHDSSSGLSGLADNIKYIQDRAQQLKHQVEVQKMKMTPRRLETHDEKTKTLWDLLENPEDLENLSRAERRRRKKKSMKLKLREEKRKQAEDAARAKEASAGKDHLRKEVITLLRRRSSTLGSFIPGDFKRQDPPTAVSSFAHSAQDVELAIRPKPKRELQTESGWSFPPPEEFESELSSELGSYQDIDSKNSSIHLLSWKAGPTPTSSAERASAMTTEAEWERWLHGKSRKSAPDAEAKEAAKSVEDEKPPVSAIALLRQMRDAMEARFHTPTDAFFWCVHKTTGSRSRDMSQLVPAEAFADLAQELGFSEADSRLLKKQVLCMSTLNVVEPPEDSFGRHSTPESENDEDDIQLSQPIFAAVFAKAVPVPTMKQLRQRLLAKYGSLEEAYSKAATFQAFRDGAEFGQRATAKGLAFHSFQALLCGVGAAAEEAKSMFRKLLKHTQNPPPVFGAPEIDCSCFVTALSNAEALDAARRLCVAVAAQAAAFSTTSDSRQPSKLVLQQTGDREGERLALSTAAASSPASNDSAQDTKAAKCCHLLLQRTDKRYKGKQLSLEEFVEALKPWKLASPADASLIFRLADRERKLKTVTMEQIALLSFGGLGHEATALAATFGRMTLMKPQFANDGAVCNSNRKKMMLAEFQEFFCRQQSAGQDDLHWGDHGFLIMPKKGGRPKLWQRKRTLSRMRRLRLRVRPARNELFEYAEKSFVLRMRMGYEHRSHFTPVTCLTQTILRRRQKMKEGSGGTWSALGAMAELEGGVVTSGEEADEEFKEDGAEATTEEDEPAGERMGSLGAGARWRTAAMKLTVLTKMFERPPQAAAAPGEGEESAAADIVVATGSSLEGTRLKSKELRQSSLGGGLPRKASLGGGLPQAHFERLQMHQTSAADRKKAKLKKQAMRFSKALVNSFAAARQDAGAEHHRAHGVVREPSLGERSHKIEGITQEGDMEAYKSDNFAFGEEKAAEGSFSRQCSLTEDMKELDLRGKRKSMAAVVAASLASSTVDHDRRRVAAVEHAEATLHRNRLHMFEDRMELRIAFEKLAEFRAQILMKFKTPPKAWEKLVGGMEKSCNLETELRERVDKLMGSQSSTRSRDKSAQVFNALDVNRIVSFIKTLQSQVDFGYPSFLKVLRFVASPPNSMLDFCKRLVQRYSDVDAGLRVLGMGSKSELDVGQFENLVMSGGILPSDAARLFRTIDCAQPGGAQGHISSAAIRFACENAQVLVWLEALHVRHRHNDSAFDDLELLDDPIESAEDLKEKLLPLTFPAYAAKDTFAFLKEHCAPPRGGGEVTGSAIYHLLTSAWTPPVDDEQQALLHELKQRRKTRIPLPGRQTRKFLGKHSTEFIRQPSGEQDASDHGKVEDMADVQLALTNTRTFRKALTRKFGNYREAFAALTDDAKIQELSLSRWQASRTVIHVEDITGEGWTEIFGYMIEFKHPYWSHGDKDTKLTLTQFANVLDAAGIACQKLPSLKSRLVERCGSLAKAWVQLSSAVNASSGGGMEKAVSEASADEAIGLEQWQAALAARFTICPPDAQHLWVLLKAAGAAQMVMGGLGGRGLPGNHLGDPGLQPGSHGEPAGMLHGQVQAITKHMFLFAMKHADVLTRLMKLLQRMEIRVMHSRPGGPSGTEEMKHRDTSVHHIFEGAKYDARPLDFQTFEQQLSKCIKVSPADAKTYFAFLDVHQEGMVEMDALLDVLAAMQANLLLYPDKERDEAASAPAQTSASEVSASEATPTVMKFLHKAVSKTRKSSKERAEGAAAATAPDAASTAVAKATALEAPLPEKGKAPDRRSSLCVSEVSVAAHSPEGSPRVEDSGDEMPSPTAPPSRLSDRTQTDSRMSAVSQLDVPITSLDIGGSTKAGRPMSENTMRLASTALPEDSEGEDGRDSAQGRKGMPRPWTSLGVEIQTTKSISLNAEEASPHGTASRPSKILRGAGLQSKLASHQAVGRWLKVTDAGEEMPRAQSAMDNRDHDARAVELWKKVKRQGVQRATGDGPTPSDPLPAVRVTPSEVAPQTSSEPAPASSTTTTATGSPWKLQSSKVNAESRQVIGRGGLMQTIHLNVTAASSRSPIPQEGPARRSPQPGHTPADVASSAKGKFQHGVKKLALLSALGREGSGDGIMSQENPATKPPMSRALPQRTSGENPEGQSCWPDASGSDSAEPEPGEASKATKKFKQRVNLLRLLSRSGSPKQEISPVQEPLVAAKPRMKGLLEDLELERTRSRGSAADDTLYVEAASLGDGQQNKGKLSAMVQKVQMARRLGGHRKAGEATSGESSPRRSTASPTRRTLLPCRTPSNQSDQRRASPPESRASPPPVGHPSDGRDNEKLLTLAEADAPPSTRRRSLLEEDDLEYAAPPIQRVTSLLGGAGDIRVTRPPARARRRRRSDVGSAPANTDLLTTLRTLSSTSGGSSAQVAFDSQGSQGGHGVQKAALSQDASRGGGALRPSMQARASPRPGAGNVKLPQTGNRRRIT